MHRPTLGRTSLGLVRNEALLYSMQPGKCARLNPRSIKKAVERRLGHPRRPDGRLATMPTSQIGVGDM
jgi:hypothetical protein